MGIGEGIGGLAGGIIGADAAGDERGHQRALIDEAIAAIQGVKLPTNLTDPIYFQQLQNAGQLTPELEQAMLSGPSAESQVKANPELVKAQTQALNALKNVSQTGVNSADRARLNQIQQQIHTQNEGQRQQIMQNFAQRGLSGSGNELLAQLTNSQNAANQANQEGLGVSANAQQNALSALGQYGGLAGQMNQQQFGQNSQTAQAADLMNRFNVQNQLGQQTRNVQNKNVANQFNLQNKQNLMNQNTGNYNQGLLMQREGAQTQFQDAMQKAGALSGAQRWGSGQYGDIGNQVANQWTNIGKGVGGIADMGFSGGGSTNTMGTGGQSGGFTQGSADFMNNYVKQNHIGSGYAEGGVAESCLSPAMSRILMQHGGHVPGEANVPGDSYTNDVISAKLSPGEIVIPRSIVNSPRAGEMAKHFVEGEIERHSGKRE